jgi:hypothetical protein
MTSRVFLVRSVSVLAGGLALLAQTSGQADQAVINDLVIANRILASDDLAVLRVYGHISARAAAIPIASTSRETWRRLS